MEWLTTLSVAMGASWVSGIRLYGAVATLGWLQRLGYAHLPSQLDILSTDWVLWVSSILFVVEFVADKVPIIDSVWDAVHTFVRIPAGAVLASAAFGNYDPKIQAVAFLLGGAISASSHSTKAAARVVVNASPEPVSNWTLSLFEDAISAAQTALIVFLPLIALGVAAFAVGLTVFIAPNLWKRAKQAAVSRKTRAGRN